MWFTGNNADNGRASHRTQRHSNATGEDGAGADIHS
jgi:hypothetical protein